MPCQTPWRDDSAQVLLFKIASCIAEGGAIAGVSSFNGRTGAVILSLADVAAVADGRYVLKSGDTMTGALSIDNGILAANDPALELSQTWNNAAVAFTALLSNVTATAAAAGSQLFDFQQGGVSVLNLRTDGRLTLTGRIAATTTSSIGHSVNTSDAINTAVVNVLTVGHTLSAGVGAAGLGARIDMVGDSSTVVSQSQLRIDSSWIDPVQATRTSKVDFILPVSGAAVIHLTLTNNQAQLRDGTAALPALTFQSDTNIGMFRAAADELAFSTSGTERARFISTGLLGVGTSFPKSRVHIVTGGASITLRMAQVETDATGKLGLFAVDHYTNAEEPLCIFYAETNVGDNRLNIGGGRSTVNAATDILFFSAVNTTTTTGTQRMSLNFTDFNMVAGVRLAVSSGANQRAGDAVLVGGTVTVANTSVTANTRIYLTRKVTGGTIGFAVTYTVIAATSFTITSDNVLDTSTYSYLLIEVP